MAGRMRNTRRAVDPGAREGGHQRQHAQSEDQGRHHLAATGARAFRIIPAGRRRRTFSSALEGKSEDAAGYDYTLRPILFVVPPGSPETFIDGRRREAEALRGRFQNCEEGIPFARALKDVAVRDQVVRSSADLPVELRKVLESIEIGRLTAPEVTKVGVEVFAVCAKKESAADNTPGKRQARESVFAERFEQKSKQYLQEIRRSAMIEYR